MKQRAFISDQPLQKGCSNPPPDPEPPRSNLETRTDRGECPETNCIGLLNSKTGPERNQKKGAGCRTTISRLANNIDYRRYNYIMAAWFTMDSLKIPSAAI